MDTGDRALGTPLVDAPRVGTPRVEMRLTAEPIAAPLRARSARTDRLILANVWVAVLAFGVAAAMAMMQAISRANLELPYRSARMYYMSVTAHGVLMALVFTTFFIMALGYAVVQRENGDVRWPRLAWTSYVVAVLGVVATAGTVLAFKASVL